jgi:dihydrolipoamide dehydrogenase
MAVGQFTQETHLVIVGGGAGGYAAAMRATQLGIQTTLVDGAESPGEAALLEGGASWAGLRRVLEVTRLGGQAAGLGAKVPQPDLDVAALQKQTQESLRKAAARRQRRCEEQGVDVIQGIARFESSRQITVRDGVNARVRFKRAIIATGSRPLPPSGGWPKPNRVTHWLGAWKLQRAPGTLLVIGGDSIALETAGAFAALGSVVSLASPEERFLPQIDPDLVQPVARRITTLLDEVRLATTVSGFRDISEGVEVRFSGFGAPETRVFEHIVVALGNRPNTDGLRLERTGVQLNEDGSIQVDHQMRTANPRIFAVGDVTGRPMLANKAAHQARVAAEAIAGEDNAFDPLAVPQVIYCDPPLAWCGLTEADAAATGTPHRVCKVLRGRSGEEPDPESTEGLVKLVFDPHSLHLLGAGIVGPGAAEVMGEIALAIEMGAVAKDLASTVHAHPTMSEVIAQAARQAVT